MVGHQKWRLQIAGVLAPKLPAQRHPMISSTSKTRCKFTFPWIPHFCPLTAVASNSWVANPPQTGASHTPYCWGAQDIPRCLWATSFSVYSEFACPCNILVQHDAALTNVTSDLHPNVLLLMSTAYFFVHYFFHYLVSLFLFYFLLLFLFYFLVLFILFIFIF